jgi:hypothetical protein
MKELQYKTMKERVWGTERSVGHRRISLVLRGPRPRKPGRPEVECRMGPAEGRQSAHLLKAPVAEPDVLLLLCEPRVDLDRHLQAVLLLLGLAIACHLHGVLSDAPVSARPFSFI